MVGSGLFRTLNRLPVLTELYLSSCSISGSIKPLSSVNFTSLSVIDISNNPMHSQLPSWLANIGSLTYFDASQCSFYGQIPLEFRELPNLVSLSLSGNDNLTANCSELFNGNWKKIEVIDLASNKLHGKLPSSFGNMSSLTYFDLFDNNVEGGIQSSIGKLCHLNFFRLMGNSLNGSLPEFLEVSESCDSKRPLSNLQYLYLSNNQLIGILPDWLGQLENLVGLSLSYNSLQGPIPVSLGSLQHLSYLELSGNELNGTLPTSLGQLSNLSRLDVSSNHLHGPVSEKHFLELSGLKTLHLSANSLSLNVSSDWIPPFQVRYFDMSSCHLGPLFPSWLRTQKEVMYLDFSNASISGFIPKWFWKITSSLSLLNMSFNHLQGQLPNPFNIAPFADVDLKSNLFEGPVPLPIFEIELFDLSNNKFSGTILQKLASTMPNLIFISLSANQIIGEIPKNIGEMQLLELIDLSGNNLTGGIPSSIWNCSYLKALDLRENNLMGNIPSSLGRLKLLQSLHLGDNSLTGELPSSFQNLSDLETLDLGKNGLKGRIPSWIRNGFPYLRILSLRSNAFSGELPSFLSNLSSLQILDLTDNKFNGSIPASFGDFKAMSRLQNSVTYLFYAKYRGIYYEENFFLSTKDQKYTKTLSLVTSIDLSGNNLDGDFPQAITKLLGLLFLDLSRNRIGGQMPENISSMLQLLFLDLSSNKLLGPIPPSLSLLSFLGYLNLSNNNFSGRIPHMDHLTTFDASSFVGNPGLCGAPLVVMCQENNKKTDRGASVLEADESSDEFIDKWFYFSVGLGYAAGILVPFLVLATKRSWSEAYFGFVDKVFYRFYWPRHGRAARLRRRCGLRH